jgi:hypothetical protein
MLKYLLFIIYINTIVISNNKLWYKSFKNFLPSYDINDLNTIIENINIYFEKSYKNFKENKVSGIYSFNKNILFEILNKKKNFYECSNLINYKYQDKLQLYYIAGNQFPLKKYVNLIFVSENRLNIIKNINENLFIYLKKIFNNPGKIMINKISFNLMFFDKKNNNPQFENIINTYMGNDNINFSFTTMENILLQQSFKDEFLKTYDKNLETLNVIWHFYEKSLQILKDDSWYEKLIEYLLNNKILPNNIQEDILIKKLPHYVFDKDNNTIKGSVKQSILDSYLLRLIYFMYNHIY